MTKLTTAASRTNTAMATVARLHDLAASWDPELCAAIEGAHDSLEAVDKWLAARPEGWTPPRPGKTPLAEGLIVELTPKGAAAHPYLVEPLICVQVADTERQTLVQDADGAKAWLNTRFVRVIDQPEPETEPEEAIVLDAEELTA